MNPENAVGLMAMGSDQVQVLVTPTQDETRILAGFHGLKQRGKIHFSNALQIAQLALKHRSNKNLRQRVIAFIASPIEHEDLNGIVNVGKKLRKNNVALDIINIGEYAPSHLEKLEKLIEAVNSENNSHFLNVDLSRASQVLSEIVMESPILVGEGQAGGGPDPNEDPELAMAIKMSLEDEERKKKQKEEEEAKKNQQQAAAPQPSGAAPQEGYNKLIEETEPKEAAQAPSKPVTEKTPLLDDDGMTEEELMKRAKELSLEGVQAGGAANPKPPENAVFEDPSFIEDLLKGQDVDVNDPSVKALLEDLKKKKEKEEQDKKK